ncbi:MAG TPA: ABC transporter permease [Alphaproteobacteria bacterium]|nr:ABC transporter permease [Alphaproteobacteria bacterium]
MPFVAVVAWRYVTSNWTQSALLIAGVAIGVIVFVFMTALIAGLATFLTKQTTGNIAHVSLEPLERTSRALPGADGATQLVARVAAIEKRAQILDWPVYLRIAEAAPGVVGVSPQINSSAFLIKGQAVATVAVNGVVPDRLNAITDIGGNILQGEANLDLNGLLIGVKLASTLGLGVGQPVTMRSDRGGERSLTVRGIFKSGIGSLDERVAFVNIQAARRLADLPQGVTQIEIKLADVNTASAVAQTLARATGLKATSWIERNAQLFVALHSQAQTGMLIQIFSLITIVIGVSSALLLTTYRRRAEIAIMRSMGVTKRFIVTAFLMQGLFIGALGSLAGAALGYWLCVFLATVASRPDGSGFPIAPEQGGYLAVILLTIAGSVLAAVLPARAAAGIDPVAVLNQ